jgi:hypothetical protein
MVDTSCCSTTPLQEGFELADRQLIRSRLGRLHELHGDDEHKRSDAWPGNLSALLSKRRLDAADVTVVVVGSSRAYPEHASRLASAFDDLSKLRLALDAEFVCRCKRTAATHPVLQAIRATTHVEGKLTLSS